MLDSIKNTQVLAAALITNLVTILAAIIKNTSIIKRKDEIRNRAKEKLDKIYTPLTIKFISDKKYLIDEEVVEIIKHNAHHLSKVLFLDIKELYNMENKLKNNFYKNIKVINEEHENLKNKISLKLNEEYMELSHFYSGKDIKYIKNDNKKLIVKTLKMLIAFCITVTAPMYLLIFYILVISPHLIKATENLKISSNNYYLRSILGIYMYILALTTILLFGLIIMVGTIELSNFINKLTRRSEYGQEVSNSGKYRCLLCGKDYDFYKYGTFTACEHTDKYKKLIYKIKDSFQYKLLHKFDI